MKIDRRAFIKRMNWSLAGSIAMLGFAGCDIIGAEKYGCPHTNYNVYTVKGAVVDKATRKSIAGIRVGYICVSCPVPEYGVMPTPFVPKSHVMTNAKGEFVLTDRFTDDEVQMIDNKRTLPVFVQDIDGEENGLYQSEFLWVEFPKGKNTVTVDDVELTEIIVDGS